MGFFVLYSPFLVIDFLCIQISMKKTWIIKTVTVRNLRNNDIPAKHKLNKGKA